MKSFLRIFMASLRALKEAVYLLSNFKNRSLVGLALTQITSLVHTK
jgi:hypothetical protein